MSHLLVVVVNGYKFHTEQREKSLTTQNSGVVVIENTAQGDENIYYYGVLIDVLELQYLRGKRAVLFHCKWFDVYDKERGITMDGYSFISINYKWQLKTNELFILASRASKALYAMDNVNKGWHVVLKSYPHWSYKMLSSNGPSGLNNQNEVDHDDEEIPRKR